MLRKALTAKIIQPHGDNTDNLVGRRVNRQPERLLWGVRVQSWRKMLQKGPLGLLRRASFLLDQPRIQLPEITTKYRLHPHTVQGALKSSKGAKISNRISFFSHDLPHKLRCRNRHA
ncbi:hypothetical protein GCM10007285_05260 [Stappia taiwanensis]|nr:hypothetical protein GCM10007285_05260 [Stappia taiwanensis]